jgi:hypothetical protein
MKTGIRDAECCNNCAFGQYYYGVSFCRVDRTDMPDADKDMKSFREWSKKHEVEVDTVCDDFEIIF